MSDYGREGFGAADEDRLPWLEPVDEEPVDDGISAGRLIAGLVVALVVLGLVVGGIYWLKQRATGGGDGLPTEIAAAPGPYKVRPSEPGGMQPKGQGDSSYATSEGADVNGQIDLSATPETPIAKQPAAPAPAPVPAPAPAQTASAPVATPAAAPVAAPAVPAARAPTATAAAAAGGGNVQLGAFSSQAKAESAWKSLSARVTALAPLAHSVTPSEANGKTVYRLRAAAGGQASAVCAKLKVAGETCLVVG